jgi:hypothetical protein
MMLCQSSSVNAMPAAAVAAAAAAVGLQEIVLSKDGTTYTTIQRCPVHYEFQHENKGWVQHQCRLELAAQHLT